MQGEGKTHSISSSPSFGARILSSAQDSDLDLCVWKTTATTKKAKGYCRSNDHKCKNKSAFPSRARGVRLSEIVGDPRARQKSPRTRSTKTENNSFVIGVRAGMHNQSLRFRWFVPGPPPGPSGF